MKKLWVVPQFFSCPKKVKNGPFRFITFFGVLDLVIDYI